jgi:hypothetical protein
MKQKEYSDKSRLQKGVEEIYNDLYPLYKRSIRTAKRFLLSNPKKTATTMFVILLLNTALLFIIIYRKNDSAPRGSYAGVIKSFKNKNLILYPKGKDDNIGLGSLLEIKNIRDSLEYLMQKKEQSKEDTLCFIRLYKRYSLIDPSLAQAMKELKRKKTDSSNLKH